MANDEHIAMLKKGVDTWNAWRRENPDIRPDLREADLGGANLSKANLSGAVLYEAVLYEADLHKANLAEADLFKAKLTGTRLSEANLTGANLAGANMTDAWVDRANLARANLTGADLSFANLNGADLTEANLTGAILKGALLGLGDLSAANLTQADLRAADLTEANLCRVKLSGADLGGVKLSGADLYEAVLTGASLQGAQLIETNLTGADLTGCRVYGVSAWGLKLEETKQQNLVITGADESTVTVDNIEVAQFVYLLLHNDKIRDLIDTIGKKGVLLLGRFTEGRMGVLERLREKLRDLGFVPMVFNFDKPETKDFTDTVRLLASLSKFVVVDITNPRSAPLELQATVPDYMVPFAPILQQGEQPFSMFVDLQNKYDWVLQPVVAYPSVERLLEVLEDKVVRPAEAKFNELLARRTERLRVENV
jgi:uncharacterized protein YjbI with pentapeptide repeats